MELRARKLKLRASDPTRLRQAAQRIEYALRSAAPADDGRLYVVRRFSLGSVPLAGGTERLSSEVTRRLAECRSRARYALGAGATLSDVVWFYDANEPLRRALERLLIGDSLHEWFWPLVLPGSRERSGTMALARVLEVVAEEDARALLVRVSVLGALERSQRNTLASLGRVELPVLASALGVPLAGLVGGGPPTPTVPATLEAAASGEEFELDAAASPLVPVAERSRHPPIRPSETTTTRALREASQVLGWETPRLCWLAAVACLEAMPSLVASPSLLVRHARRVVLELVASLPQSPSQGEGRVTSVESEPRLDPGSRLSPQGTRARARIERDGISRAPPLPSDEAGLAEKPPLGQGGATQGPPRARPNALTGGAEQSGFEPRGSVPRDEARGALNSGQPGGELDRGDALGSHADQGAPEPVIGDEDRSLEWDGDPWAPFYPRPSTAGGLLFLIRVLDAIGLPSLLDETEPALELGLPARVLAAIALGLEVSPKDPLCEAMTSLFGPRSDADRCASTARASSGDEPPWVQGVSGYAFTTPEIPDRMPPRAQGVNGCDEDWSWRLPRVLEPYLDPQPLGRLSSEPRRVFGLGHPKHEASLSTLVGAFVEGCYRFCRDELELEVPWLVLRPALVSASPTHLDVSLPLRSADARIRIAGLDIDPGWVSWLGRIVTFYYRDGNEGVSGWGS